MVIVRITGKPEIIQQEKPGGKTGLDSLLQRDRALLRGSATENPTYGVLCERRKCGPHHLLHLPEIQSGMENPHPQPIYTSCLTSPADHRTRSWVPAVRLRVHTPHSPFSSKFFQETDCHGTSFKVEGRLIGV